MLSFSPVHATSYRGLFEVHPAQKTLRGTTRGQSTRPNTRRSLLPRVTERFEASTASPHAEEGPRKPPRTTAKGSPLARMEGLRDGLRRASLPVDDFDDDRVAEVLQRLALGTEGGSSTPCGPVFQQFGHGGDPAAMAYFKNRTSLVRGYFPGALGCEDFLNRMEIALSTYGFNGDNSIGNVPSIPPLIPREVIRSRPPQTRSREGIGGSGAGWEECCAL